MLSLKQYLKKRESDKKLWIAKTLAHIGDADEEQVKKEAIEKFNENYPEYKDK